MGGEMCKRAGGGGAFFIKIENLVNSEKSMENQTR